MSKTLRPFLTAIAVFAITCLTLHAAPKPNIVHIMIDDLGWQDIASHKVDGKPVYETPHLDRLTRQGRRFTQGYSPAPTCAPSRAAFLRGQFPANTGVYHVMGGRIPRPHHNGLPYIPPFYPYGLSLDAPTIPKVLRKAGYVSGHVGKWHLGGKSAGYPFPPDQGFDFGFSERNGRSKYYNDPDLWRSNESDKNSFFGSWSRMKPDRLSDFATAGAEDRYQLDEGGRPFDKPLDLALGFLKKYNDRPFFLNFCTYYVHGPIQTRDRARFDLYLNKMGQAFPDDPEAEPDGPGHINPYYGAMVDTIDWMVGQVITCLETTDDPRNPGHKLIDNTYVVLDSDNGGWIGNPGRRITDNSPLYGGKQTTYEGGIRIPFLVRGPNVPAGTNCDTPVSMVDLFPTFMAMAGLKYDAALDLDGCDILPLIHGTADQARLPSGKQREALYWYFPTESHMSSAIRKGPWKLIRNYGVGMKTTEGIQLFRLYHEDGSVHDLGESNNLADKEPATRDALLADLEAFLATAGISPPYRNRLAAPESEQASSPAILSLGTQHDRVWVTFETGKGKVAITEAKFLYTLSPRWMDSTRGHREEWFSAAATIQDGRVTAIMPPGATHGAFCLRDANDFLITSESMPSFQEMSHGTTDTKILENGFAYKPGLFALIKLGEQARNSAKKANLDTTVLEAAIASARQAHESEDDSDVLHCNAIRMLRVAIRSQEGAPEAANYHINRFPLDPLF